MKNILINAGILVIGFILAKIPWIDMVQSLHIQEKTQIIRSDETQKPYAIYETVMVCKEVCNWYDDLVAYAWKISNDMEFLTTITQESHWDRKAKGKWSEEWLCQWTHTWREFKFSREFKNPLRQIDKCREQFQQWRIDGALWKQLTGYKDRHQWEPYFELKQVFVGIGYK